MICVLCRWQRIIAVTKLPGTTRTSGKAATLKVQAVSPTMPVNIHEKDSPSSPNYCHAPERVNLDIPFFSTQI